MGAVNADVSSAFGQVYGLRNTKSQPLFWAAFEPSTT